MEILASVIIIFATVMHTLIPEAPSLDVRGAKIAHETTITDRLDVELDSESTATQTAHLAALEEAREARRQALEEARISRKEARESWEEARDEFRERLAEIRDARKRRILEHIADRLNHINERWTTHFDNVLTRLSEILAKVGTRADKLSEAGQDVSAVRDAITDAEASIAAAQDAVNAQAEKTYVIEITEEEGLREDVQEIIDQLHSDLRATREVVKLAREGVHDAFAALKDAKSSSGAEGGIDVE